MLFGRVKLQITESEPKKSDHTPFSRILFLALVLAGVYEQYHHVA
jgi:hypothetical protein